MKKGIGSYINDMGVEFSVKYFNLIDYEFNEIGFCVNFDIKKRSLYKRERTKLLKDVENSSYFFNHVLQCLANIKEFKNFYFDRTELISLIDNNSIFSKYIYKIVLDMWNTGDDENDNHDIYENLLKEIIRISESNKILNNASLLIEFLLLRIHNEIRTNKEGKKIKSDFFTLDEMFQSYKELNDLFYPYNNSFIQNLFFFEVKTSYKCPFCKSNENHLYVKCILDFDLDQKSNKIKNTEYISIYDFLSLSQNIKCIKCDYISLYRIKINTCPKILIIAINLKERQNFKFKLDEEIDISNYMIGPKQYYQTKYKLISTIVNNSIVYCRAIESNKWYYFEKATVKILNHINNNLINAPYLLIYKQIPIKHYNYYI